MGNASDTSAVFISTISKEHDILMGSLYSVFCKSHTHIHTRWANLCCFDPSLTPDKSPLAHRQLNRSLSFLFYRCTVPHGQLHPATCCVSQAVDLEAGRVLHHQSFRQWPWDGALFIPFSNTVVLHTQVSHIGLLSFHFKSPILSIKLISQGTITWL